MKLIVEVFGDLDSQIDRVVLLASEDSQVSPISCITKDQTQIEVEANA